MEALKLKATAVNGLLTVKVPEAYNNKEIDIILSVVNEDETQWKTLPNKDKLEILKRFAGKDKFPDVEIDKHDVYDQ